MDYSLDIEELKEIPFDKYQKTFHLLLMVKNLAQIDF